jgi:hypothetical protein
LLADAKRFGEFVNGFSGLGETTKLLLRSTVNGQVWWLAGDALAAEFEFGQGDRELLPRYELSHCPPASRM